MAGSTLNDPSAARAGAGRARCRVGLGLAALAVLVIGYAWVDGGREPLHEISQPLAVPAEPVR